MIKKLCMIGMLAPAIIELNLTYPDNININNQIPSAIKAYDIGKIANNVPNAVPTPFPPLNLKNIG